MDAPPDSSPPERTSVELTGNERGEEPPARSLREVIGAGAVRCAPRGRLRVTLAAVAGVAFMGIGSLTVYGVVLPSSAPGVPRSLWIPASASQESSPERPPTAVPAVRGGELRDAAGRDNGGSGVGASRGGGDPSPDLRDTAGREGPGGEDGARRIPAKSAPAGGRAASAPGSSPPPAPVPVPATPTGGTPGPADDARTRTDDGSRTRTDDDGTRTRTVAPATTTAGSPPPAPPASGPGSRTTTSPQGTVTEVRTSDSGRETRVTSPDGTEVRTRIRTDSDGEVEIRTRTDSGDDD